MNILKFLFAFVALTIVFQSCGIYDLRTDEIKENGIESANIRKGKMILEKSRKAQGMDKIHDYKTYSFDAFDTWQGMLGKMGKVWKDNETELSFKFRVNSFDGQVQFLDGQDQGTASGLQDWNFYDVKNGKTIFSAKEDKENVRKAFALAAYQYFSEMIDRLYHAPIISYAGEEEFRGQKYDLVFCTWGSPEPHMEHDQYMAWINKETGLLEFAQYSLRESYLKMPGYKLMGGGVELTDFRNIDGVLVPHHHIIYPLNLKEDPEKNLHELKIRDFAFDKFDESELQVDKQKALGDGSKK